ncbi:MAG: hypothetical protein ACYCXN_12400, partial [Acidimicrobiales bacterium]
DRNKPLGEELHQAQGVRLPGTLASATTSERSPAVTSRRDAPTPDRRHSTLVEGPVTRPALAARRSS